MVSVRWCAPESCSVQVTGQLVDMPTCGFNKSRAGQVMDWTTRALVKSWSSQLADTTGNSCCYVSVGIVNTIKRLLHIFCSSAS